MGLCFGTVQHNAENLAPSDETKEENSFQSKRTQFMGKAQISKIQQCIAWFLGLQDCFGCQGINMTDPGFLG